MKKMIKLLSIGVLTSITSLQAIACTDDSKFKTFTSDVDNSKTKNTAIFGFLGTADDANSNGLSNAFQFWQNSATTTFKEWKNTSDIKTAMEKKGISDIELKSYEGSPHQTAQSVSDFWNDKSIIWQRNIFNWIVTNKDSKSFIPPSGIDAVKTLDLTHLDSKNKPMFTTLPIVFCIVKGELYTAGQGWDDATKTNSQTQISDMETFILSNILLRNE